MTAIRVLIVDDHPVVRDGLRGIFSGDPDFEVVGEAADGAEAIAQAGRQPVDVVLMDLRMPGMGGVEAITRLRAESPQVHVLVLTTYDSDRDVLPAIEAGATGYPLKDAPPVGVLPRGRRARGGGPPGRRHGPPPGGGWGGGAGPPPPGGGGGAPGAPGGVWGLAGGADRRRGGGPPGPAPGKGGVLRWAAGGAGTGEI